jgi:radical SAM protein with 4Fe4S-binding SPASM domain
VVEELEADTRPIDDRFANRVLQLLQGGARSSFCGAGRTTFGFLPDGSVTPCVLIDREGEDERLGHIDSDPAEWVSAGQRWVRRRRRRAECRQCSASPLCGGGCPAILPVCGANECEIIRKNCEIARGIHRHFEDRPEKLLPLAGIL